MKVSFTTNVQEVLSEFDSLEPSQESHHSQHAESLLFLLASDNNTRAAILPTTTGWFALTLDFKEKAEAKLQVLGTNADGYLVFSILRKEAPSSQLCTLNRGECLALKSSDSDSVINLHYEANSVDLRVQTNTGQSFFKTIIRFTGHVPRSKIGKGEPVARPLDDKGVNRVYLDHSLVNIFGERAAVSFARTEHTVKTAYPKHAHMDDNVRFVCSGKFRFTIFDPDTDVQVHECEVASGDSIQVPAGYAYIEEVIEPGVQFNARSGRADNRVQLHHLQRTPGELRKSAHVPTSLGIFEKQ